METKWSLPVCSSSLSYQIGVITTLLLFVMQSTPSSANNCNKSDTLIDVGRLPLYIPDLETYLPNTTVLFNCSNTNDEIYGPPSAVCEEDGTWLPSYAPICLLPCGDPGTPNGGIQVDGHGYGANSVVTFECNATHAVMVGAPVITCDDGIWSSSIPVCYSNCDFPGLPNNGSVMPASETLVHGVILEYSCDSGFLLTGNDAITCNNGTWSASIPQCIGKLRHHT